MYVDIHAGTIHGLLYYMYIYPLARASMDDYSNCGHPGIIHG